MRTAPLVPGRFGFPLGVLSGVLATLVVVAAGATVHPELSVVAMVIVASTMATVTSAPAALGTMVVCWCLHSGFVLGRHGELALTPTAGHDALLLALITFGAIGLALAKRTIQAEQDEALRSIPVQRQADELVLLER